MSEFDRLQELAIPKAEDNKSGEKWGQPGTPPISRERLMKKAALPGGVQVTTSPKGAPSPHAGRGINQQALEEARGTDHMPEGVHPDDAEPINPGNLMGTFTTSPPPAPSGDFDPMSPFEGEDPPVVYQSGRATGKSEMDVAQQRAMKEKMMEIDRDMLASAARTAQGPTISEARMKQIYSEAVKAAAAANPVTDPRLKALDAYLRNEAQLTAELDGGTFMLPVLNVRETGMAVMVMTPTKGLSFIPKAGTKLTIGYLDKTWVCYYPGTYAAYEDMGFNILCFLKENVSDG